MDGREPDKLSELTTPALLLGSDCETRRSEARYIFVHVLYGNCRSGQAGTVPVCAGACTCDTVQGRTSTSTWEHMGKARKKTSQQAAMMRGGGPGDAVIGRGTGALGWVAVGASPRSGSSPAGSRRSVAAVCFQRWLLTALMLVLVLVLVPVLVLVCLCLCDWGAVFVGFARLDYLLTFCLSLCAGTENPMAGSGLRNVKGGLRCGQKPSPGGRRLQVPNCAQKHGSIPCQPSQPAN
ncbi:hypothetical protein J3E69DRAFT_289507 [Trichoderma sp. SZMC 28015]